MAIEPNYCPTTALQGNMNILLLWNTTIIPAKQPVSSVFLARGRLESCLFSTR